MDGRPYTVPDHGHPVPSGSGLKSQGLADRHQFLIAVHRYQPGLAEGAFDDLVRPGEEARVGERRPSRRRRPTRFEDHDRLAFRHASGGVQETAPVLETLQVEGDHAGVGIVCQEGQQVGFVDVDPVAITDELAHAEGDCVFQEGDTHRARLTEHGHRPGRGTGHALLGLEEGVQPRGPVEHPDAVGADDTHAQRAGQAADLGLQCGSIPAQLLAAPGYDHQVVDVPVGALPDEFGDCR